MKSFYEKSHRSSKRKSLRLYILGVWKKMKETFDDHEKHDGRVERACLKKASPLFPEQRKVLLTTFIASLYIFGNSIPLGNIDNLAVEKSFQILTANNNVLQSLSMLSNGQNLITFFTLGVLPYINASLIIDFLAQTPLLEKLQTEEGGNGKKRLQLYKKILSFLFAIVQSVGIVNYLKPYLFINSVSAQFSLGSSLVVGAFLLIFLCNTIDSKGFGNGTSLIILINIVRSLLSKIVPLFLGSFHSSMFLELWGFYFLFILIATSQSVEKRIPLISARQLFYLKNKEIGMKDITVSYIPLKATQSGIFPIITAVNFLPIFSYIFRENFSNPFLQQICYYFLIIIFSYFFTTFFWDPQKISEELRKQSVSIPGFSPGKQTEKYLSTVATSTSLRGGAILCFLIFCFDSLKSFPDFLLLKQTNITSLIIGFGIALDLTRLVKSKYISRFLFLSLKKNSLSN